MELRDFLSEIKMVSESDLHRAFSLMAADLSYFVEASHGARARRHDSLHRKIAAHTAHLYQGVSPRLVDVGHAAFRSGLHASQLHHSKTAHHRMKVKAHDDAHDSHMTAAEKLRRAGHEKQAIFHMAAADTHMRKKAELTRKGPSRDKSPSRDEGVADDMRNVHTNMHVVAWKMQKLKDKIKQKQSGSMPAAKPIGPKPF